MSQPFTGGSGGVIRRNTPGKGVRARVQEYGKVVESTFWFDKQQGLTD